MDEMWACCLHICGLGSVPLGVKKEKKNKHKIAPVEMSELSVIWEGLRLYLSLIICVSKNFYLSNQRGDVISAWHKFQGSFDLFS